MSLAQQQPLSGHEEGAPGLPQTALTPLLLGGTQTCLHPLGTRRSHDLQLHYTGWKNAPEWKNCDCILNALSTLKQAQRASCPGLAFVQLRTCIASALQGYTLRRDASGLV